MNNIDIAGAWKKSQHREFFTREQCAQIPEDPCSTVELNDTELATIMGAFGFGLLGDCYGNPYGGGYFGGGYSGGYFGGGYSGGYFGGRRNCNY